MNNSTDNNYLIKNELDTENHTEPNLFNNSVSYDHIREKSKIFEPVNGSNNGNSGSDGSDGRNIMEEIMKNLDNLKTTETDMKFEYMANPEKLVQNIKTFEKFSNSNGNGNSNSNNYNNNHIDDHTTRSDTQTERKTERQNTESINDYISKPNSSSYTQNNYSNITPKPSQYGPSVGDGPTNIADNSQIDQYYGFGSEEELHLAKLDMLRKLLELKQNGINLSQNYSMNSDYKAMKYEYELHRSIKDKHNGVKWLSNMMLNICWGVELANDNFNPFEFKLKGWSEQMNEDTDEYYDVLGELYEKYFKSGKPIPPELKLVLMIGGSAVKFHIAHTALSKIPNLSEALLQNPALAHKLNEQAVADKVKEQYDKQKEAFDKKSDEQHNIARKKAEDLQMLKDKQTEFIKMQQQSVQTQNTQHQFMQQQMMQQQFMQQQMMQQQVIQQQLLNKQKQLEELQKQLNQQRSDSRSVYTNNSTNKNQKTMQTPIIPESLRNKFTLSTNKQQNNKPQNNQQFEYNNIMNMGIGSVMPPDNNQEIVRQQQIMMHKKQMQEKELSKSFNKDNVSIDPNIDNIINDGFNDTQSRISDDNNSKDSRGSKVSRRSRKKPAIRIET
jgi:hypothetical protein